MFPPGRRPSKEQSIAAWTYDFYAVQMGTDEKPLYGLAARGSIQVTTAEQAKFVGGEVLRMKREWPAFLKAALEAQNSVAGSPGWHMGLREETKEGHSLA